MNSVRIMITGAVSIAIQFGLAIAGWGGWSAFFAHPAFRALAGVTVGLACVAIFSGGGISRGEQEDRGNRWVLGAFTVIALLMAFFSSYTDRIGFWTLDGGRDAMGGRGGVLFRRTVAHHARVCARNRFSGLVAIQPGHTLETPAFTA